MSNTKQLANLSEHAYKDLPLGVNPFGKDTEVNIKGKNYYVLEHASNPKTGYQGTIYQDISTREIIVAHRGTEPKSGKPPVADLKQQQLHYRTTGLDIIAGLNGDLPGENRTLMLAVA